MAASKQDIAAIYPLSPLQQGMLFHTLYNPAAEMYFEQFDCTLVGRLNIPAFQQAWQYVLNRHPILRTLFMWDRPDKPLQVVRQQVPLPWTQQDWRDVPAAEQAERLVAFLQADRAQGFDLAKAPLLRLALLQLADDAHQFIWSFHHVLLDGWSTGLLFREVFSLYECFCRGEMPLPAAPPRPYRDYIQWLQQQDPAAAEDFWRRTLRGFTNPTPLPGSRAAGQPAQPRQVYGEHALVLAADTTAALQYLARQQQVTLNTVLQGAWALLLSRYNSTADVLFGATVAGRPPTLAGVEDMIGLFINTLPVRVAASGEELLPDWLRRLQAAQAEARQYDYVSLAQVQAWSEAPPGRPLFDHILVFENYPVSPVEAVPVAGLTMRKMRFFEKTNYPLTVTLTPGPQLTLQLSYDQTIFEPAALDRLLATWQTLLAGMVATPGAALADLPWLTETERQQILVTWNETPTVGGPAACIHHLFENQVRRNPDAVAVVRPASSGQPAAEILIYETLNRRANQLAHYLRRLGVGPEVPVGICLERSPQLLVAILGVLKAGGAYVPLDPHGPVKRLVFMLAETQAPLLLTGAQAGARLPATPTQAIDLEALGPVIAQESEADPACPVTPQNLAYIIYTSGSTGRAKGVMVSHASLVNAFRAWEAAYELGSRVSCHLQMANFTFDVFSGDWVRALCSGGRLVLCPWEFLLLPDRLYPLMCQEGVDCAEFVPAVMRPLRQYLVDTGQTLAFMRLLVVASDSWSAEEYRQIQQLCGPATRLVNSYGLTEATVDSSYFESQVMELPRDRVVPIGRPFANTQLYVLDGHLQPVPIGVAGELYVGGAGLARGYLRQPGATAEKFIPNPFARSAGERLYKTGDLARYLPDGNIEFLGRLDYQVKVRGFRIELGEIETVLSQHPGVRETVVLVHEPEPGNKRLAAYVIPAGEQPGAALSAPAASTLARDLRHFLQSRLPGYMIPAVFVPLAAWPLTPSGKIDRQVLGSREVAPAASPGFVTPRTPTEITLAGIWADLLGLERVGAGDNFFELGGHSLLAIQLLARVRRTCQVDMELCWLFETPTLAGLAETLDQVQGKVA